MPRSVAFVPASPPADAPRRIHGDFLSLPNQGRKWSSPALTEEATLDVELAHHYHRRMAARREEAYDVQSLPAVMGLGNILS